MNSLNKLEKRTQVTTQTIYIKSIGRRKEIMLKFINLKKLTAQTLFSILVVGSFIVGTSDKKAVAACANNNTGNGNNAPFTHVVAGVGKITIGKYDPEGGANGASGSTALINDLKAGKTVANGSGGSYYITFTNNSGTTTSTNSSGIYSLGTTDAAKTLAATAIEANHPDWEINGNHTSTVIESGCGDRDSDSIGDNVELGLNFNTPLDTDNDDIPNYADTDSDNDGRLDSVEGAANSIINNSSIAVTLEAPGVQSTQISSGTYVVNFNDQSGNTGFVKTNGTTTYTYGGQLNVKSNDQFGGAIDSGSRTNYITQKQAGLTGVQSFNVKVNQDQKYFGFWWSAGDSMNKVIFKNDGQEVAAFQTKDLENFIENSSIPGRIGACGSSTTNAYCGNPTVTPKSNSGEPYSYVNVFFNNKVYDEVVFETSNVASALFESDNHTFSALPQTIRGTIVPASATAVADSVISSEDSIATGNVITNDEGSGLTVTKVNGVTTNVGRSVTLTSGALITLDSNGTFTYNPNGRFEDLDANQTNSTPETFTYEIRDNKSPSNTSSTTVTMTINGVTGDSDGDGITNTVEGKILDTDGDGQKNYVDTDSDGDTINDSVEGTVDTDGDGQKNYVDTDSDGDTINDSVEGTVDTDSDGTPNYKDTDSDGDSIPDKNEKIADSNDSGEASDVNENSLVSPKTLDNVDGDGLKNYLDLDSDGDNLPDNNDPTPGPYVVNYSD